MPSLSCINTCRSFKQWARISAKFPKDGGGILYDGTVLVPKPAEVSFFEIDIRYRQNLAYDPAGPRAQVFSSSADVLANGGNLAAFVRAGGDDNNYVPEALACVVFFVPKGKKSWADKIDFKIENGSGSLVPAFWILRGTAYRSLMPQLRVALKKAEGQGRTLASLRFSLDSDRKEVGNNWVYVPVLTQVESNPPELIKLLDTNFER